jgi:L-threonylcarbamoyladenylate synthase
VASHDGDVERAVAILLDGGLVAFPTETVYGLGADATNAVAVRRLYAVKGRPPGHPVIAHVAEARQLDDVAHDVHAWARALAAELWPGPLTLVVRRRAGVVVDEVTGGLDTVGVRVPAHPLALALLAAVGRPVAAPSANRFGRVSPTTAAHVRADLGADVDLVLDGGPSAVGVESTIVDATGDAPVILRVGGVTAATVAHIAGMAPSEATHGEVAAPGTLESHYAPAATVVVVDADDLAGYAGDRGAVVLALARVDVPPGLRRLEPAPVDADEYARVLYARLREADELGARTVVAVPPPALGVGVAVHDRLARAASVRTR